MKTAVKHSRPLSDRRWYRRLTMFFNIIKDKSPSYLTNYLPSLQFSHNVNRNNLFNRYHAVTDYFNNSFFPYCVNEWNRLSPEIRNSKCIYVFKKLLLKFICPNAYDVYNIHDPIGERIQKLCHIENFFCSFLENVQYLWFTFLNLVETSESHSSKDYASTQ